MQNEPMINKYLRQMLEMGGSDLHLSINFPAKARIHGNIQCLDDDVLDAERMEHMLHEICVPEWRWTDFMKRRDLDFAHEIPGLARFRCNFMYNFHGMGAVLRQIPSKILTMEELKLPEVLKEICNYQCGLVLVTGPTGSGKSTTLAAMIDYINANKGRKADCVIELTSNAKLLQLEASLLREKGRLVIISSPKKPTLFDFEDYCANRSISIIGCHNFSHPVFANADYPWTNNRHCEQYMDMVRYGMLNVKPLVSRLRR